MRRIKGQQLLFWGEWARTTTLEEEEAALLLQIHRNRYGERDSEKKNKSAQPNVGNLHQTPRRRSHGLLQELPSWVGLGTRNRKDPLPLRPPLA
jgi:hypothetical protein